MKVKHKAKNIEISLEKLESILKKEKAKGSRLITITCEKINNQYYMIYHFDEKEKGKIINYVVKLGGKKAKRFKSLIENCDLYERECSEMFGIDFGEKMKNLFLAEGLKEPY